MGLVRSRFGNAALATAIGVGGLDLLAHARPWSFWREGTEEFSKSENKKIWLTRILNELRAFWARDPASF